MTLLLAATYPERVGAVVLFGTGASFRRTDDYPWAPTPEERIASAERRERLWGDPAYVDAMLHGFVPSAANDPDIKRWWAKYVRTSASPTPSDGPEVSSERAT